MAPGKTTLAGRMVPPGSLNGKLPGRYKPLLFRRVAGLVAVGFVSGATSAVPQAASEEVIGANDSCQGMALAMP